MPKKPTPGKTNIVVLGAGKVGKSVAELLLARGKGEYAVTLADASEDSLALAKASLTRLGKHVKHATPFTVRKIDAGNHAEVKALLAGHHAAICMLPFDRVPGIAQACRDARAHYFDVTEDIHATAKVEKLAAEKNPPIAYAPQCGLAPGYVAIAAASTVKQLDSVEELYLRVGALPQFPTNALKYNLTWSADGVINEYCKPCRVMLAGQEELVPALDGLEHFTLNGCQYEAFYTSGGVGSLINTLRAEGRLAPTANVAYKTIRYPGHRDLMKFLLDDLRFGQEHSEHLLHAHQRAPGGKTTEHNKVRLDRALLVSIFNKAVSWTPQDVVLVFVNAVGQKNGRRCQFNFQRVIPATDLWGRTWPAIELTTAAGVCAILDMHRIGELPKTGLIKQESVSLAQFNGTPFGPAYENPAALEG